MGGGPLPWFAPHRIFSIGLEREGHGLPAVAVSFGALNAFTLFGQAAGPTASIEYTSSDVNLTVRLLKAFGDTRVLSSPKIMALNNQTAVLQVVENVVYFEVNSQVSQAQTTAVTTTDTTAKTVPVGVILAVTPQIDGSDQVILNVRPTISRIVDFVNDPNPISSSRIRCRRSR